MSRSSRRHPLVRCIPALLLLSCVDETESPWDAIEPDTPCLTVDLTDGLDDGAELGRTLDCLDRFDHLASLRPTRAALETPVAGGGDALAASLSGVLAQVSVPSTPPAPEPAQDLGDDALSWLWELCTGQVDRDASLERIASPLTPMGPDVAEVAARLREQPAWVATVIGLLSHDSLEGLAVGTDRALAGPRRADVEPVLHDAAALFIQGDPTGSRTGALVDDWIVDPVGSLPRSFVPLQALVSPPAWRTEVVAAVATVPDLQRVPRAVAWLTTVDADGHPRVDGEPSALVRILTVLGVGNQPVDCELDLGLFSLDWSFDNTTVRLLQLVAGMSPGTLGSAASLWERLTGSALTDAALDAAIASGTCPAFDEDMRRGVDALELLTAPEAAPLLELSLQVLSVSEAHGRLPAIAGVCDAVHSGGGIEALDAWLEVVGPTPAAANLARATSALAQPPPVGSPALEHGLDALFVALTDAKTTGFDALPGAPAARLYPLIRETASMPGLRQGALSLVTVWGHPDSASHTLAAALGPALAAPEPWRLLRAVGADAPTVDALLATAAHPGVLEALTTDEPGAVGPAPLHALAARIQDGSLDAVIDAVERTILVPLSDALSEPQD